MKAYLPGVKIAAMLLLRVFAVFAGLVCCSTGAGSQIISEEKIGDKTVECMHSGLSSDLMDCGSRSDWYAYVFVGRISAITAAANAESQVQIVPEEVFSGSPQTPMAVLTSQGLCLPKLAVGDRWLFYLRKVDGKPIVLDYYGNDSLPVAKAQREIETLRKLKSVGDFGLLRGRVFEGKSWDGKALPHAQVFASRKVDERRFSAVADSEGRYEFQPLPPVITSLTNPRDIAGDDGI